MIEVDALRFGLASEALGYSTCWRVWYQKGKSDVYVAGRTTAGMFKISLHESGQCHVGHTSTQARKDRIPKERRLWKTWRRPEPKNGLSIPFHLIIPVGSLRPRLPNEPNGKPKPTLWIEPVVSDPAPDGLIAATYFTFAFLDRPFSALELTQRTPPSSIPIGGIEGLPNGQRLLVYCYPAWTDIHSARDPKNAKAIRIQLPKFDPRNARGSFIGGFGDGSGFLCELAGDQF